MLTVIRRVTTQYRSPLACCSIPPYLLLFYYEKEEDATGSFTSFPLRFCLWRIGLSLFFFFSDMIEGISML